MKNKSILLVLTRYLLLFIIGISLLTTGLWIISISEDTVKDAIRGAMGTGPLSIEIEGIKKGLFYNLNADRLILKMKEDDMIYIEDISARINPLYLFLLRYRSSFNGRINNGLIIGSLYINRGEMLMDANIGNVEIGDIPYLKTIGLRGKGILSADIMFKGREGNIKFDLNNAELETFTFSGIPLPMEIFNKAEGMVDIKGDEINIVSFSLEGRGVYSRIKGVIKNNQADLSMEIMPEASAQDKFAVLTLIEKYKVSPGYYLIPIKANLSF